ncbi:M1 family metallopeptidase [Pseudochryseolinea flava]|uniref:M1 family peptidase n=1 Tax=Pseudochryseolinea flava TaxID=2059302 RepID=A0A364Y8E6_9BACT|nr:M1 family metallopeptidase [Pseudochryseolinea flava]RAW03220.1 M1 family peptidase [Pseudochryseolinea flava]
MKFLKPLIVSFLMTITIFAQAQKPWLGKFEQLDQLLPTPNEFRNGSGAPGYKYWQQRADYVIDVELDEQTNTLKGKETITYFNNSPEVLSYVWLQLDQNVNKKGNEDFGSLFGNVRDSIPGRQVMFILRPLEFEAGYTIESVTDKSGKALQVLTNNTMMRVDLTSPIKPGESFTFNVAWHYPITDRIKFLLSREGYESYPDDNNNAYLMGHWYPRLCSFDDFEGWQNQQFQRLGEFALEFGNFTVNMTVPSDHVIASTGVLQNPKEVLTSTQLERFEKAKTSFDKPLFIITVDEAKQKEKTKATSKRTWRFKAENVRDFSWASSRKFIWDVQAVKLKSNTVLAMSFYPKDGLPVWPEESTKAVKNALEIYSEHTFDYPYPIAISVNTSNIGMEYPMISFNGGRPQRDGSMSAAAKKSMIGTIVHEVGHNYFPMIVSSDERQWFWMDEGLNTFLQEMTEEQRYQWDSSPKDIVPYMKGTNQRPVMTAADHVALTEIGNNAYQKPATALMVLRETVMGPELFDKAFKEYSNRWMYKHPKPADFFRTMEDVSGVDLDWFWRGWFFTTDHVNLAVVDVKWFKLNNEKRKGSQAAKLNMDQKHDFSGGPIAFTLTDTPEQMYGEFRGRIDEQAILAKLDGKNLYQVTFKNIGGLVMPLVIEWTYKDGSKEIERIPAEIWRHNEAEVTKVFVKAKEVVNIVLDPNFELADADMSDNTFPRKVAESKFDQFKKAKD